MATVTAIYWPFLVAVRNTAIGTHWGCVVIQMFDKTPATEKFPNLQPYGAFDRVNTVNEEKNEIGFLPLSKM